MGIWQGSLEVMDMNLAGNPDPQFWRGRRVLVTGHTGFKGAWLTLWLHRLGAQVTGVGLAPATNPSLFELARIDTLCESHLCDIREAAPIARLVQASRPEIVFHLAAQALVRAGYSVTTASDGDDGLTKVRARLDSGHMFDLVVSDVVMPAMDGPAMARALRQIAPGLPVLFMSGYAEEQLRREIDIENMYFIPKPFPYNRFPERLPRCWSPRHPERMCRNFLFHPCSMRTNSIQSRY